MSAYRPLTHPCEERPFKPAHGRLLRFAAGCAVSTASGLPVLVVIYTLVKVGQAIASALPPAVLPLFALYVVANAVIDSLAPGRPASAIGCLADEATAPRKRVAVIGGGASGLMVAKELQAEGHDVVVFEARPVPGGAWIVDGELGRGRVWEATVSSSSALNTAISDFPLQSYYPEARDPFHLTQSIFADYLRNYMVEYDLERLIRLRTTVTEVSQCPDSKLWTVVSREHHPSEDGVVLETFDAVAVCTGQVHNPRRPFIPGQESFAGDVTHVADVRSETSFRGKTVVCVGNGESASDVVELVSHEAKQVYLVLRNPFIVLPRNFFGVAPDFFETRSLYTCPSWVRWLVLKPQLLTCALLRAWNEANPETSEKSHAPDWKMLLGVLFNRQFFMECLTMKRTACASLLVTKTERMMYSVDSGACKLKQGGLTSLDEKRAYFGDGTSVACDSVLLLTGYRQKFPMFQDCRLQKSMACGRYLLTFDAEVGSSLAYIGFCRGHAGSLIQPAEMQARWFALLVSGKRRLPSTADMKADIAHVRAGNTGYAVTLGGFFLTNYIAREHVGCAPRLLNIALQHGARVAWRVYTQSFAGYMFRFSGPHARPALAARAYATVATCGKPVAWYAVDALTLLAGAIFHAASHIPGVARLRRLTPLTRVWW